jgi:hypothetical protein
MGYGFGVVSVAFLFDGVLNGRYSKIGVEGFYMKQFTAQCQQR